MLTIIETTGTNATKSDGMETYAEELAHLDYSSLVASALKNVPLSPDGTVEGLAKVNYGDIIKNALSTIDTNIHVLDDDMVNIPQLRTTGQYNQPQLDSLSQLMAQRSKQVRAIQLQMEKLRFPIEEIERSQEVLNWRKDKLTEQRTALIEKHQQLLYNDGKQKLSQIEIEKQVAALEPEIKKLESSLEALNQQVEAITAKEEEAKLPMEKLERESEQLEQQLDMLSNQLDRHSARLDRLTPGDLAIGIGSRDIQPSRVPRATARTLRGVTAPAPPIPPGVRVRKIMFPKPASAPALTPAPAIPSVPAAPAPATRVRGWYGRTLTPKPALAPTQERF